MRGSRQMLPLKPISSHTDPGAEAVLRFQNGTWFRRGNGFGKTSARSGRRLPVGDGFAPPERWRIGLRGVFARR